MMDFAKNIFFQLFKVDNQIGHFLRLLYHRLAAMRFFVYQQKWKARRSYLKWRILQKQLPLPRLNSYKLQPRVTFLLEISSNNLSEAIDTIQSIRNLCISNWEIITVQSGEYDELLDIPAESQGNILMKRILLSQSDQINRYKECSGDFIIHCAAGDRFFGTLLNHFYQSVNSFPLADAYYYDCEYWDKSSSTILPFFKPASFSPDLLLSVNYLSRGFIRKTRAVHLSNNMDISLSLLNQEFKLLFLLSETKGDFQHIPHVLITQSSLLDLTDQQVELVVATYLSKAGLQDIECQQKVNGRRFQWKINDPSISIIIPSKNSPTLINNLINSIIDVTDYPNYTIIIVDNDSSDPVTLSYYSEWEKIQNIKVVNYDKPFNYSEAINFGVKNTSSELLLLLNNDMKAIDPTWLRELAQWAIRPEIGVVGTKLIRENHTIQHAGMILGMNGFIGHLYLNASEHYVGLLGSVDWFRDLYAVTGACQMLRRDVFDEVGGYDENYRLVFGDIDFCLRIHKLGYRVMYTPFAPLIHYEGKSRGYKTPVNDLLRGYEKMAAWLEKDDPYFSPNLTYTPIPKCQFQGDIINSRLRSIQKRKQAIEKNVRSGS